MIKLYLKNRPYGFVYPNDMPSCGFTEITIPVTADDIAVTGDYMDIAKHHCACICAMNTLLVMNKNGTCGMDRISLNADRRLLFKEIHKTVKNGPVVFFKPKINKILKGLGLDIKFSPVKTLEGMEKSVKEKKPVAMLLNAGITQWHWILVIGVRKYMDGSIYLNILDGWNKTNEKFLKFKGRETFIRALMPESITESSS